MCPQCGNELSLQGELMLCRNCNHILSRKNSTCFLEPEWDNIETVSGAPRTADSAAHVAGLEFLDKVGAGGFGTVYRAIDKTLDREVAVKILHHANPDVAARFETEAVITGNLQHQNIVPVHMAGCDAEGRRFFTMKILDGSTLAQVMERLLKGDKAAEQEFPLPRLLQVFLSVCDAVSYAHSRGVIHRDLKPENIMLGAYGEVYVLDWGLAKIADARPVPQGESRQPTAKMPETPKPARFQERLSRATHRTLDGMVLGTPGYIAPEQILGSEPVDGRGDVFSLGAVLFEILTGTHAIDGEEVETILSNTTRGEIKPLSCTRRGKKAPRALGAIALKALAISPADRYASVAALARDVRNFLEDRPVSVYTEAPWNAAARWARHNRTLAGALGAAALVGVAALLAVLAVTSQSAQREAKLAREKANLAEAKALAESKARHVEETQRSRLEKQAKAAGLYVKALEMATRGPASAARAETLLNEILEIDPAMFDAYRTRAEVRAGAGRTKEALADYLEANRCYKETIGKDNPEILARVGMIHWTKFVDFKKAGEYFARASLSDPENAMAQFAGGILSYMNGERDPAIARMKETAAKFPDFWEGHFALGMMYMGNTPTEIIGITGGPKGVVDAQAAIASFTRAIELNPTYGRTYVMRAQALVNLFYSKPNQDKRLLEDQLIDHAAAVRLDPKSFEAHLCRLQSNYYIALLEKELARKFRCMEVCEEELRLLKELGKNSHHSKDRIDSALAFEAARLRLLQGRAADALTEINAALALHPEQSNYQKLKAEIEAKLGSAKATTR